MMPVLRLTDSDTVTVATANRRAVVVLAQHVTRIKQERERALVGTLAGKTVTLVGTGTIRVMFMRLIMKSAPACT